MKEKCVLSLLLVLASLVVHAQEAVTITVQPGARQTFAGFGTSLGNWGHDYQKLTPPERTTLSRMLWHDLRFKTLRLWMNTFEYAPTRGAHDLTVFRDCYVDSGIIADAKKQGMTTLLLAPDGMPDYVKAKRAGGPNDYALKDDEIAAYAGLLADFIARLKAETGVQINATGLQNEPNDLDRIAPEQMGAVVKALRRALDARGLRAVKIIGPENANVDGVFYDVLDRLKADPAAWAALDGIASHSYGMAATDDAAKRIAGTSKSYWMTEASANGPEAPGDAVEAASLAARFLSDMNHRVTHWIHFLGFEVPDPKDNATRILAYTPNPLRVTVFQKYYYYRQLSDTFDVGAVFRASQSSLDDGMTWTYGPKPHLVAAAGRNPDGSWGVGLTDFTLPEGDAANSRNGFFNGDKAQAYTVTVNVPELANVGAVPFTVYRSSGTLNDVREGNVTMTHGSVTVTVYPLELVTLRSKKRVAQ